MTIKRLTPILWTENIEETISFYTKILGFTCREQNQEWQWASLYKEGIEIMIAKPNDHIPYRNIGFTGSFYFEVETVETLWEELKNKTKVAYELELFEWNMKEFAIYDNNGYLLQFGEEQ